MGFMSDRFQTRWGRRKPWIAIGVPIYAVAVWMLLNPDQGSTVLYLALFFILLRLATTILGLPYAAWGMELSDEYHTRTMIQSAREKYVLAGLIVASAIVLISEEVFDNRSASFVLSNFSWVIVTLLPLTALLVILKVPEVAVPKAPRVSIVASLRQMTRNKLFFRLLMIELLIAGGENFRNTLSLFFVQDYVGADRVGRLYVLYFGVGLLAIPVWDWIARRFGKHQSLATAMVLVSIIAIACFMLDYGQITEFYVLFALKGFCFGAFAYLPRAMLADVVDFDTVRSGTAQPRQLFCHFGLHDQVRGILWRLVTAHSWPRGLLGRKKRDQRANRTHVAGHPVRDCANPYVCGGLLPVRHLALKRPASSTFAAPCCPQTGPLRQGLMPDLVNRCAAQQAAHQMQPGFDRIAFQ